MVTNKRIIYVGAKPDLLNNHAGGQTTASIGLIEYAESNNIELHIIDSAQESFPPPTFKQRLAKAVSRVKKLIQLLKTGSFDGAIIFSSAGFSFYEKALLALICRVFKCKSLLFIRSGHFMMQTQNSKFKYFVSKILLKAPNYIGAQGSNWLSFYEQLGVESNKVSIIRNWLPSTRAVTKENKILENANDLTFIFVGWVVKNKGVFELIEAVEQSSLLRKCRIIIAGGGDALDEVKAIIDSRDLTNIELLGWQSHSDIDNLLKEAHVFVLPTYAEGFPNALLEAISQGLPAVITPVGAIPDSALHQVNSEIVVPKDVVSLKESMEKFYLSPQLVEQYSKESIRIANQQHDRLVNCKKLFELFD